MHGKNCDWLCQHILQVVELWHVQKVKHTRQRNARRGWDNVFDTAWLHKMSQICLLAVGSKKVLPVYQNKRGGVWTSSFFYGQNTQRGIHDTVFFSFCFSYVNILVHTQRVFYFPLKAKLRSLLTTKRYHDMCQHEYLRPRSKSLSMMTDIYDALLWRKFMGPATYPISKTDWTTILCWWSSSFCRRDSVVEACRVHEFVFTTSCPIQGQIYDSLHAAAGFS